MTGPHVEVLVDDSDIIEVLPSRLRLRITVPERQSRPGMPVLTWYAEALTGALPSYRPPVDPWELSYELRRYFGPRETPHAT